MTWTNILILTLLTVCSGVFYRMGGAGKHGQWYENVLDTKWRDLGCPLCVLAVICILGKFHISAVLSTVLMFGAMTTYWKKKGEDARWHNWFITGLMYAIAWLPYCHYVNAVHGLAYYAIIVSIATMAWSQMNDNAVEEEIGRGIIVTLFAPLLTIGA